MNASQLPYADALERPQISRAAAEKRLIGREEERLAEAPGPCDVNHVAGGAGIVADDFRLIDIDCPGFAQFGEFRNA